MKVDVFTKEELEQRVKPDFPKLTNSELNEAMTDLHVRYPMVIRDHIDPPYVDLRWVNISFNFLTEPKKLSDGNNIFGFMKVRGAYRTEVEAIEHAKKLIKTHDSNSRIRMTPIGHYVPISDSSLCEARDPETVTVNDEDGKEMSLNLVMNQERIAKERAHQEDLQRRADELRENVSVAEEAPIRKYIGLKVKEKYRKEYALHLQKQLKENMEILDHISEEMGKLGTDADFPHWLPVYNAERKKAGLSALTEADFKIPETI